MIDNLNQKIITSLKRDGRYSYARLAKELGVNVATVAKRIDKMLEEDVITIKTVLNPFKFGFNAHSFITLDINLSKVDQVCAQLVSNPNISLLAIIFGRFDVLIIADFPSYNVHHFSVRLLSDDLQLLKEAIFIKCTGYCLMLLPSLAREGGKGDR